MNQMDWRLVLVCPSCNGRLTGGDHSLTCCDCRQSWKISHKGIPSFASRDFYWNQIPREDMTRFLLVAREKGYRHALEATLLPKTNDYVFRYALDESRSDFKFLLPLSSESRVLDIGCGWGAVTVGLARRVGEVWGVDSTLETLEFVKLRAEQEALSNIRLLHADVLDFGQLPLPSDFFDVVLLNGVLEWIGVHRRDVSPRQAQVFALKEIRRTLKHGGTLYVGIENRFSYTYFGGSLDHSGLPFTSLVPRWLASVIMQLFRGQSYRTYTYSRPGYVRLLNESGFKVKRFLVPLPSYREPNYLMDLDHRPSIEFFFRNLILESDSPSKRRKYAIKLSRQLARFGLYSAFCPSFSIISEKAV
jgi:ubiquinone/menaquinone biosynthesis C-methylase UbiE